MGINDDFMTKYRLHGVGRREPEGKEYIGTGCSNPASEMGIDKKLAAGGWGLGRLQMDGPCSILVVL